MTRFSPPAARDWASIAIIGVATFLCFSAGRLLIGRVDDSAAVDWPAVIGMRLLLSVALGAILVALERRRDRPTMELAIREGLLVAAIIIIVDNLGGPDGSSRAIALRTATMLVGLPLMGVLTHLVVPRIRDAVSR